MAYPTVSTWSSFFFCVCLIRVLLGWEGLARTRSRPLQYLPVSVTLEYCFFLSVRMLWLHKWQVWTYRPDNPVKRWVFVSALLAYLIAEPECIHTVCTLYICALFPQFVECVRTNHYSSDPSELSNILSHIPSIPSCICSVLFWHWILCLLWHCWSLATIIKLCRFIPLTAIV